MSFYQIVIVVLMIAGILSYNKVVQYTRGGGMKTILKYPGAKNRLAPWIVSNMPSHEVYLEPFFGSGAVFFNKQPCFWYLKCPHIIDPFIYRHPKGAVIWVKDVEKLRIEDVGPVYGRL